MHVQSVTDTGLAADLARDIEQAEAEIASTCDEIEQIYHLGVALTIDVMRGHQWVVRMSEAHLRLIRGRA